MNWKWADIHIAGMHSGHICRTDVCEHPVLFIPSHMGVTELAGAQPNPWEQSKAGEVGLQGVGCCCSVVLVLVVVVEVARKLEPQLTLGQFSAVIALCAIGPGVSVTAAQARRCCDAPPQKSSAKMPNTADENLTYCPKPSED